MSKAYKIDGRDPSAKGYVKVGREANARELVAINKELNRVWVLTIRVQGQNFPEVHKSMDGAIKGALDDIEEHDDEISREALATAEESLQKRFFYEHTDTDTVYDIVDCPVCD